MKKSKIAASVIGKIKSEKIKPHSKLYFFAKFSLILIGGIIFFLIGTIAASVIWHFFKDPELLEIFATKRMVFLKLLLVGFPIFWFVISISLGVFTSFLARNTKKGYKMSYRNWLIIIILGQILLGFSLEETELEKNIEYRIEQRLNMFKSREINMKKIWQSPKEGMLMGKILEVSSEKVIFLDIDKKEWEISFSKESSKKYQELKNRDNIRIMGNVTSNNTFLVKKVFFKKHLKKKNH